MKRFLLVLLVLLIIPNAFAVVDLISPDDNHITSNQAMLFEYYASVEGLQSCTLYVGPQSFPDIDAVSNAMNDVQVQNIAAGAYDWNVTCIGNATETSLSRRLTIDILPPTLVIIGPDEGITTNALAIDIIPNDDVTTQLACTASWLGTQIDAFTVTANTHYVSSYNVQPGTGELGIVCTDDADNGITEMRSLTVEPQLFLILTTDKPEYGIGEPALLTIDTIPGADVTIDVCPNTGGFVQCTSALIDSNEFPQMITLPYMNKTGEYLVDGLALYNGDTVIAQPTYMIVNSMLVSVEKRTVGINTTITLTANVVNGIPPYTITWLLTNNTVRSGSSTEVSYDRAGEYNVSVTVIDSAQNTFQHIETITIDPVFDITFIIVDNATGVPVQEATVDFEGKEWVTLQDGLAFFEIDEGRHRAFITAPGYEYAIEEYDINTSRILTVQLNPSSGNPVVYISLPEANGTAGIPSIIQFSIEHTEPVTCSLLKATESNWFLEDASMDVADPGTKSFVREYAEGLHSVRIECTDVGGRTGTSPILTFTASPTVIQEVEEVETVSGTSAEELFLQKAKEDVEQLLDGLKGYEVDEQEIMNIVGFDKQLRKLKQLINQAIRDVADLEFKDDLNPAQERARITSSVRESIAKTPLVMNVRDEKQYVKYVEEEHSEDVLSILNELEKYVGIKEKHLLKDQQKFTVTSKIMHIEYVYKGGEKEIVTFVVRELRYAESIEKGYKIVEIIPKNVAKDMSEITLITEATVLVDDPVLEYGMVDEIVYVVNKEIAFNKIEDSFTVLVGTKEKGNSITGMAIFTSGNFPGLAWPILILFLLIAIAFISYRFNFFEQVKYIMYRFSKKERVHYVRVVINDAEDQLQAQEYDKAELLYKEVRMTYDTLSELEKNDLYDDVMGVVHAMDSYYFNMIMLELDGHIKAGDMNDAIDSYEKLVGTYERLGSEEQMKLVDTVFGMAKRLGVEP